MNLARISSYKGASRSVKVKPIIVKSQAERHRSGRIGWLRAAVLGADDAIVSTASLMIGVAAASASKSAILVAGVAGLVAGAMPHQKVTGISVLKVRLLRWVIRALIS